MPRFFIAASNILGGVAYINEKDAEHIKVLRIRQGELFTVCDGNGNDYTCRLTSSDDGGMSAEIVDTAPSKTEPSVEVTVFSAFSKGDKPELIIQKCVELGASKIVFFPSKRCVVKIEGAAAIKKADRWQKIAQEAAKQSERGHIPKVEIAYDYQSAIKLAAQAELPLFLFENEKQTGIKSALTENCTAKSISIVTGPEGGFEDYEATYAKSCGMISVSLGPRILRCETAPICALSAVMLLTDNM